ncbi:VOC family protein [Nocardia sp. CDC160]|uniref:VOC family protein n=1 Tax=Nocardia sp. CDC160 TaxID=3112166 RepID=UPI002DBB0BF5|nr:VOC family protein [Nocardia sp. CDC160]MEC3914816.1 VOC family protein [Nocardia sp. CDC160]
MLTTEFVTGSPNWLDLGSPEPGAAAAFYAAVFGWQFQSAGPDAGGYGFLQVDGKTVAGLGQLTEEGASSAWTVYFQTPDADAAAKAAEQAGATIRTDAFDVMGAGRMANLTDPQGAPYAVWQPGDFAGFELASAPNALGWVELHVADPAAAAAFYGAQFGWRAAQSDMPDMPYTILSTSEGDLDATSFGGIAPLMEGQTPHWLPYFGVEDVDDRAAAVTSASGAVIVPPMDIPSVGRFAILADPFGAQFAMLKPEQPA